MNKYKVIHKVDGKQAWIEHTIEATCIEITPAGDLVFYDSASIRSGAIAAGWWRAYKRVDAPIDPQPPVE